MFVANMSHSRFHRSGPKSVTGRHGRCRTGSPHRVIGQAIPKVMSWSSGIERSYGARDAERRSSWCSRSPQSLSAAAEPAPTNLVERLVGAVADLLLRCYGVVMRSALARSSNAAARAVSIRVVAGDCGCPAAALANVCLIPLTN